MSAIIATGVLLVAALTSGAIWAYYGYRSALLERHRQQRHAQLDAARAAASWQVDAAPTGTGDHLEIRLQRVATLPWGTERQGRPLVVGALDQQDPNYEVQLARLTRAAHQRAAELNILHHHDPDRSP